MVSLSSVFFYFMVVDSTLIMTAATPCTTDGFAAGEVCNGTEGAISFLQMKAREKMKQKGKQGALLAAERHLLEASGGLHLMEALQEHTLDELHAQEALSEKQAGIDCADEVLLRLAITESFHSPSYDSCVQKMTEKVEEMLKEGGTGWGSDLAREELEKKISERCITRMGHGAALGPRLIRMTFHDGADFRNSQLPNGEEVPIEKTGVDACLRTALLSVGLSNKDDDDDLDEIIKGEPNHNRGLNNAIRWVLHMSSASKLSRPDMMVLGAVTAMEAWLGMSELGVRFGREAGDCPKIVCNSEDCWDAKTPFFKQPVAEPVGSGMFCPMTNTLEPLRQLMNLTMEELVALQGAHSVGGVIVCSGLGNVASGPYCPKKCGIPPGDFEATGNLDGTSFDDTPGKMDNRYYQLLMDENYDELPACKEVDASHPRLSKRGLAKSKWKKSKSKSKSKADTCDEGVEFEPENACEVEACVHNCSSSEVCMQAENSENDDTDEFREAWNDCLLCKKLCSGSHSKKVAQQLAKDKLTECKVNCKVSEACNRTVNVGWSWKKCLDPCNAGQDTCKEKASGSKTWRAGRCYAACGSVRKSGNSHCRKQNRHKRKSCIKTVKSSWKICREACKDIAKAVKQCGTDRKSCVNDCRDMTKVQRECKRCPVDVCKPLAKELQDSIYNMSAVQKRPAAWCKRLSETKQCLDPNVKMPINGGWGKCPEDKQLALPNTGAGRLTIIQNLDRWTKFKGLFKRVMVLPSDWSYLGKDETKNLFKKFGADEAEWKRLFTISWNKISELGQADKLSQCSRVSCINFQGNISCPVQAIGIGNAQNQGATNRMQKARAALGLEPFERPSNLVFEGAKCDPPMNTTSCERCELIGGYGVKAKLSCNSVMYYCTTAAALAAEKRVADEWTSGGGQQPTCTPEATTMLATDSAVGLSPH
mmetsp:Transcript_101755/g.180412  ORF Transcript_101755/g.180412 Transcript_101755/m.180412 type:complete len:933 (-) Transcript_101755:144-2942(-)